MNWIKVIKSFCWLYKMSWGCPNRQKTTLIKWIKRVWFYAKEIHQDWENDKNDFSNRQKARR
jgi:hypothetical protein